MIQSKPFSVRVELNECRNARKFGIVEKYHESNPDYFVPIKERLGRLLRRADGEASKEIQEELKMLRKLRTAK